MDRLRAVELLPFRAYAQAGLASVMTAHVIFTQDAKTFTGRFCIDDTLLYEHGVTDFEKYRVDPSVELAPDFFVPDSSPTP